MHETVVSLYNEEPGFTDLGGFVLKVEMETDSEFEIVVFDSVVSKGGVDWLGCLDDNEVVVLIDVALLCLSSLVVLNVCVVPVVTLEP